MALDFVRIAPPTAKPPRDTPAEPASAAPSAAPSIAPPTPAVAMDGATPVALTPLAVECLEDTGLEAGFISDLILKIFYFQGVIEARKVVEVIKLPYRNLVDGLLEELKTRYFIEVQGANGPHPVL